MAERARESRRRRDNQVNEARSRAALSRLPLTFTHRTPDLGFPQGLTGPQLLHRREFGAENSPAIGPIDARRKDSSRNSEVAHDFARNLTSELQDNARGPGQSRAGPTGGAGAQVVSPESRGDLSRRANRVTRDLASHVEIIRSRGTGGTSHKAAQSMGTEMTYMERKVGELVQIYGRKIRLAGFPQKLARELVEVREELYDQL